MTRCYIDMIYKTCIHMSYLFFHLAIDVYPLGVYNHSADTPYGYIKTVSEVSHMAEKKECCACSEKRKERSPEEYKDLLNRLSRIEGQVRGIKAMVERGAYCPDILIQTSAVNAALNSFSKVLLSNHIRTCVRNDIKEGNDEVVEELVATLQKMMK